MKTLRTLATLALMAGLVGGAYWISLPSDPASATKATASQDGVKCRPHDDCARMARSKKALVEAAASP